MDNILIKFVVDAKLSVIVNTLGGGIRFCKGSHGLAWGVTCSQRKKFVLKRPMHSGWIRLYKY